MRRISWFSCGAASAVATKLSNPDMIAYCDTGAEDSDNKRFMIDCENWFLQDVTILKSEKYESTWDVWEDRKYIAGVAGAPCTMALKIKPRLDMQKPDDVHIFGYTADKADVARAERLRENWPDFQIETPLIDKGITKEACLAIITNAGIKPPRTYAMGFPNANCMPCPKATSSRYWALCRQEMPEQYARMVKLSRRLGARLCRINGVRSFIDEIPLDHPTTNAVTPACDFLCQMAEIELRGDCST